MYGGGGWWSFINQDEKDRPKRIDWAVIRRVLGYARPYRVQLASMLLLIIFSSALNLVNPQLFRLLIDTALPSERNPSGDVRLLDGLVLVIVAIALTGAIIAVVQRRLNSRVGEGVIYELRSSLFAHLQKMSLRFFTNSKTGELMSRLNNDVVGAQSAINSTLIGIFTNIVVVIATLTVMLAMEWRLTILGLLVVPLFVIPARRVGVMLRALIREQSDLNAAMNQRMNETLNVSGALLVKLFGKGTDETNRFRANSRAVADAGVKRAVTGSALFAALGLISAMGVAVTYWVGGHLVFDGVFSAGTIVAFALYLGQIYGPLQSLANIPVEFASSMVSFERVFEVLDIPVEILEKPDARALTSVRGDIAFEDVSFEYAPSRSAFESAPELQDQNVAASTRPMALQDVSFSIPYGKVAALVGPSGAGKTTITYLLPRLYDPTDGRVTLDGIDLRDLSLSTLSDNIGMVTQETYLFHDTIKANLVYARPEATEAEMEAAARAANIHEFITTLPNGYETVVGERGYRLSGGEKQRIAIARVLLKDPRILVLDEATSHLDSQSEAAIQSALETVMQNRTSLVIAHRLSTIIAADLVLVLDHGRIVESGTHSELLAQGGLYAALYHTQFASMSEGVITSDTTEAEVL